MLPKRICLITALILILTTATAQAADALFRFMHNDHNVLAICEVKEINGNACDVTVSDTIVGKGGMGYQWTRMEPETMKLSVKQLNEWGINAEIGDYLLVSAKVKNKDTGSFDICWGAYHVDSLDPDTMKVVTTKDDMRDSLHIPAIEHFVHTGGQENDFSFDGVAGEVYYLPDGAGHYETATLIYSAPKSDDGMAK